MLYIRNMDNYETHDACFASIDDVPDQLRTACMMLDIAADLDGTACINYVGRRDNVGDDTYYYLASKWATVKLTITRNRHGRIRSVCVSQLPKE